VLNVHEQPYRSTEPQEHYVGQIQEDFIREFCDAWGDGSLEKKPQVEKILSMMSEDAVWQLWIPGGPVIRGRTALREEILRQMTFATNNKCNIVNMLSSDTMVMTERADTAVIYGRPCPHQMVAVYELDENGLIKAWREYLDMVDLMQKMGVGTNDGAIA
jgi:limonene-1,2-epoxide hydrolase